MTMAPRMIEMVGRRFGRLVVIERVVKPGNTFWLCKCDCGNEKVMGGHAIRKAEGCGCVRRERLPELGRANKRHGMCGTPIYNAWSGMKDRCLCETNKDFHKYGGRGIKVCDRWLKFDNFYADMGDKPKGLSLDRIDVNGDYTPENCRWADLSTQSSNQRRFQDPVEKAKWLTALRAGQIAARPIYCAAQTRRWKRWCGIERLPMLHREGWKGPKQATSTLPYAWFLFKPEKRVGPIALERISWRTPQHTCTPVKHNLDTKRVDTVNAGDSQFPQNQQVTSAPELILNPHDA